jgi:hypothetical protein
MGTRIAVSILAGALLLLAIGAATAQTSDTAVGSRWPKFTPDQTQRAQESGREYRIALRAGEGARAIDLLCRLNTDGLLFAAPFTGEAPSLERFQAWADSGRALMHARYDEAFRPPANADALCDMDFPPVATEAPPARAAAWSELGAFFAFNRDGVSSLGYGDERRFIPGPPPSDGAGSRPFAVANASAPAPLVIDLDRDGTAELTFDGREAVVAPGLASVVDRAPDGRRAQWLIATAGADPRAQARIWLYRDGPLFFWLLDTDGDGRGNCGTGEALPGR